MFFSAGQVSKSFSRLKGRKRTDGKTTKTHLEKTSALMCFLAFDATCKITQSEKLDLNPTSDHGKKIRGLIAAEFSKLVLLTGESDNKLQFIELGKVVQQNKSPEVRFSSNFLTVPLKKASEQAAPYSYPNRPRNAEVLKLGEAATGFKWGMAYHERWSSSLPMLLSEVREGTPFTDLAILTMRNTEMKTCDYIESLGDSLAERYTVPLAELWISRIKKEKMFFKVSEEGMFSEKYEKPEWSMKIVAGEGEMVNLPPVKLVKYIRYLQERLAESSVLYTSIGDEE